MNIVNTDQCDDKNIDDIPPNIKVIDNEDEIEEDESISIDDIKFGKSKKKSIVNNFQIITPSVKKIIDLDGLAIKGVVKKKKIIEQDLSINMPWVEKYRPKSLDDVVAQKKILTIFREAVTDKNKSIPHMILCGPPGSGKTSVILAVTKQLFGPNIYRERVYEFNASDDRGIGVVREKIKNHAEAMIGRIDKNYPCPPYKIIILDEADAMTQDAQSALRIIIEKNSKNTRFCLICNYINQISEQILSRCTKFRFKPVDDDSVRTKLIDIAKKENIFNKLDESCITIIIKLINGDLRKGITLLQRCITLSEIYGKVTGDHISDTMGVITPTLLKKYLSECTNIKTTINSVKNIMRLGYPACSILEELVNIIINDTNLTEVTQAKLIIRAAKIEKKLIEGANETLQLIDIFTSYCNSS
jgi:replication factor C subunit 2/4